MMNKFLLTIILLALPVVGADLPSCYNNGIVLQGAGANNGAMIMQFRDSTTSSVLQYNGSIWIDDPTHTSLTDVQSGTSVGNSLKFTVGNTWGTGSKNPQDGAQHKFYGLITNSPSFGTVQCPTGDGWPYTYNIGQAAPTFTWPLYNSAITGGMTASNLGLIFSVGDTYSVGSSGSNVCGVIDGVQLKDDGVAGKYINAHSLSCSNVFGITFPGGSPITVAQANTAYATITPSIPSTIQFLALAWRDPSTVGQIVNTGDAGTASSYMSITGYFTLGGVTTQSYVVYVNTAPNTLSGDTVTGNNYFLSTSGSPFSNNSLRPAMLLAYATCSTCTGTSTVGNWTSDATVAGTAFSAAASAVSTFPSGMNLVYPNVSGGIGTFTTQFAITPAFALGLNTGICRTIYNCTQVSPTTNTNNSNVLGYDIAQISPPNTVVPTMIGTGVAFIQIRQSGGGDLSNVGTNQETAAFYNLSLGAAGTAGSVNEPGGRFKVVYVEQSLFHSCYTNGGTMGDCIYRATNQPWGTNMLGDPLACPFCAGGPPPTFTGTYIVMIGAALILLASIKFALA